MDESEGSDEEGRQRQESADPTPLELFIETVNDERKARDKAAQPKSFEGLKEEQVEELKKQLEDEAAGRREGVTVSGYNLLLAAGAGDLAQVQRQLAAKADPNFAHDFKWSPLLQASLHGHHEVVAALLAAGAEVSTPDATGTTPLHAACSRGHQEVVESLTKAGADVAARDNDGGTPLHAAAQNGFETVVFYLVEQLEYLGLAPADPTARDDYEKTALDRARSRGHRVLSTKLRNFMTDAVHIYAPYDYMIRKSRRGTAVIISMEALPAGCERIGGERDRERLTVLFEDLNFRVLPVVDRSRDEILEILRSATESFGRQGCFVLCVLACGDPYSGTVRCADGTDMPLSDVCSPRLFGTRIMRDVPKVVLINTCGPGGDGKYVAPKISDHEDHETYLMEHSFGRRAPPRAVSIRDTLCGYSAHVIGGYSHLPDEYCWNDDDPYSGSRAVGAFVDVVSARRGQDDVALMFTSMFHKMASHLKTKKAPADVQNTCLQQVMHAVHGRLWWR
jgi:hypothetical protein